MHVDIYDIVYRIQLGHEYIFKINKEFLTTNVKEYLNINKSSLLLAFRFINQSTMKMLNVRMHWRMILMQWMFIPTKLSIRYSKKKSIILLIDGNTYPYLALWHFSRQAFYLKLLEILQNWILPSKVTYTHFKLLIIELSKLSLPL